jgi:hypothetical protein
MITNEMKSQFNQIFEEIGNELDISESQYNDAVRSYKAVGSWLADTNSLLSPYKPEILPQGSFLLGTMIKPVHENDDLDVDLVCRLEGKKPDWTQYDVKQIVGNRIKEHGRYGDMLDKEGRRCWTLKYADGSNYHMDILPSVVSEGHKLILERAFGSTNFGEFEDVAIRITDNQSHNYYIETNPDYWNKSNPFGYAVWFQNRCSLVLRESVFLSASVNPMPKYQKDKLPLQRAVQILKRHRDIMFNGNEDKPISIIITTLSAKAYQKEADTITALINIVNTMESYIEKRHSVEHGKWIEWIGNPLNDEENFADKWVENPDKQKNFFKWLNKAKADIRMIMETRGIPAIKNLMTESFGESIVNSSFNRIADNTYQQRESGQLHMAKGTGLLGASPATGTQVKKHNFHGED